ncbi:MAG TPA: hypothetical protein VFL98_02305 [Candidatus Paceibacterota bacterium]|nr:hypothetical protein [Candidatus Paceibacterota bacterium]
MSTRLATLVAAVLGIGTGFLTIHSPLAARWESIFVWGAIGLVYGALIAPLAKPIWPGAAYGFFMSMAFFIAGFAGAPDRFLAFLLIALAFSIAGAIGGIVVVWLGSWLRRKLARPSA